MVRIFLIIVALIATPALAFTDAEKVCIFKSAAQLPKIEGMQLKKASTEKPEPEALASDPKTIAVSLDVSIGGAEMSVVYWCSDKITIMRGIR